MKRRTSSNLLCPRMLSNFGFTNMSMNRENNLRHNNIYFLTIFRTYIPCLKLSYFPHTHVSLFVRKYSQYEIHSLHSHKMRNQKLSYVTYRLICGSDLNVFYASQPLPLKLFFFSVQQHVSACCYCYCCFCSDCPQFF